MQAHSDYRKSLWSWHRRSTSCEQAFGLFEEHRAPFALAVGLVLSRFSSLTLCASLWSISMGFHGVASTLLCSLGSCSVLLICKLEESIPSFSNPACSAYELSLLASTLLCTLFPGLLLLAEQHVCSSERTSRATSGQLWNSHSNKVISGFMIHFNGFLPLHILNLSWKTFDFGTNRKAGSS